jgi:hypothetical protein
MLTDTVADLQISRRGENQNTNTVVRSEVVTAAPEDSRLLGCDAVSTGKQLADIWKQICASIFIHDKGININMKAL